MTSSKRKPNRLRKYREAAGLTQEELAAKVGAGRVTIVRAEQGTQAPSLKLAGRLADELDTTIDELFSVREGLSYDDGYRDGRRDEREEREQTRSAEAGTPPGDDPHGIAAFVAMAVAAPPSAPDQWRVWRLDNPRGTRRKLDAVVFVEVSREGPREAKRLFKQIVEALSGDDDTTAG